MKNISKLPPWVLLRKLGRLLFLATYKSLYYWLAISGAIVVVLIAGFYLAPGFMFHQVLQTAKQQSLPSPTIGNMNGVKLSIPYGYRQFPMEYEDESVWEPKKEHPFRTFDSRINNFSIHVQWPTLEPRSPKNEASFLHSSNILGAHGWLVVGINAKDLRNPSSSLPDLGLSGRLRNRLTHPERSRTPAGVRHELKGLDPITGLQIAVPVGAGSEKRQMWNDALYWNGDRDQTISTYIECPHGAFSSPDVVGSCHHSFVIQELKSEVAITYKANLLPQWREIQAKTQQLIMSFKVSN